MVKDNKKIGDSWQQNTSDKEIDVVVLVSQRRGTDKHQIAKTLHSLQKTFKANKFDSRYALVGFGGKGVHEEAHVHALGHGFGVFSNSNHLRKEIAKNMPFEGEGDVSNDAYHAIVLASKQSFRPAAHKVFIIFNTEP